MKKGFTLIELLVVIAIIGLLSSIVFASISSARDKANIAKAKVQGKEIEKAIELSRLSNNSLPMQTDTSLTMKEIIETTASSPIELAIEEFYSGDIPSIPDVIGGEDNEYYYISNGDKAIDEYGNKYRCGYDHGDNGNVDEYIIFYKIDTRSIYPAATVEEYLDGTLFDNVLFFSGEWDGSNPSWMVNIQPGFANDIATYMPLILPDVPYAVAPVYGSGLGFDYWLFGCVGL